MEQRLVRLSKFMSLVLRHKPGKIGLTLDEQGWAEVDELVEKARKAGVPLTNDLLREVVEKNDKQRFKLSADGRRIRASQGHSIPVDLGLQPVTPPERLYHGTAERFLESIRFKGLRPGSRQHVHLSPDVATAIKVGSRHGAPVVLVVRAGEMHRDGYVFYLSDNGIWLTVQVPPAYLEF
jgi:putative RNA 2'-phosphotransferase